MVKLIALYRMPDNPEEFDEHYRAIHTPLVKKMPGLRRMEVARITGSVIGEPAHYLVAEMYFDSKDALDAALASPAGRAAGKDLVGFAAKTVTLFHAEVRDEYRGGEN